MKIIIVDDEVKILTGMSCIFSKQLPQHQVVAAVKSPFEALSVLQTQQVDIVFTDVKMPDMSGIELTQLVHNLYPQIIIVILSAYSDFNSVRLCMKNGAFDYLLKPVSYQAIIEITQRVEPLIIQAKQGLIRQHECQMLQSVLNKEIDMPTSPYHDQPCRLYVFCVGCFPGSDQAIVAELCALLDGAFHDVSLPFRNGKYLLALQGSLPSETSSIEALQQCVASFRSRGANVYGTYGDLLPNGQGLIPVFAQCSEVLDFLMFNELPAVATPSDYLSFQAKVNPQPLKELVSSRNVSKLISGKNIDELVKYLANSSQNYLKRPGYLFPHSTRQQACEIILEVSAAFHDVRPDGSADEDPNYLSAIMNTTTLHNLLEEMCRQVVQLSHQVSNSEFPGYIYKSTEYIQQNYMHNLTLKNMAELVNLNPWYFSTQFKRYLQQSFSEYLTIIRIEAAKALLQQNDLKIYEISEMVGFQEPTYFNTVFKKTVGTSPKGYQNDFSWK